MGISGSTEHDDLVEHLVDAALALARRFSEGATLWSTSPPWPSHAGHVAVEFVHPAMVGKPALPALAVEAIDIIGPGRRAAARGDVVLAVSGAAEPSVIDLMGRASAMGVETVWIGAGNRPPPGAADHVLWVEDAGPLAGHSGHLVLVYHVLWELTHVCLEHPGLIGGAPGRREATIEPTGFLYPFLDGAATDGAPLMADLARSAATKWVESLRLQAEAIATADEQLDVIARELAPRLLGGGTLFTFGNGGSASAAASMASLFAEPPVGTPVSARCLAQDAGVLTALANDVGVDLVFSRQISAYAKADDVALGISTSGDSRNLLPAFGEARRCGLATVAIVGGGGGRCSRSPDVAHCVSVRSDSVHRVQEAQAALALELWSRVQSLVAAVS